MSRIYRVVRVVSFNLSAHSELEAREVAAEMDDNDWSGKGVGVVKVIAYTPEEAKNIALDN